MKVVLDTNIFISGIFWTGNSNKIIQIWKEGKFSLITSSELLTEFIETLKNFKIQLPENIIKGWIELIVRNSSIVEPVDKLNIVKGDPKDNMFLEAAIEGEANYIITQDNHLIRLKSFKNVKILTPEEFLQILSK